MQMDCCLIYYSSSRPGLSVHLYVQSFWPLEVVLEPLVNQNHLGAKFVSLDLDHFRPRPFLTVKLAASFVIYLSSISIHLSLMITRDV